MKHAFDDAASFKGQKIAEPFRITNGDKTRSIVEAAVIDTLASLNLAHPKVCPDKLKEPAVANGRCWKNDSSLRTLLRNHFNHLNERKNHYD